MNKTWFGDCRTSMKDLIAQGRKVQMCVISPPYYGLRDYKVEGQLGLEPTPDEYITNMVEVFHLVKDLLADDGVLWVNIGDSYAANRTYQVPSTKGGAKHSEGQSIGGAGSKVPKGMKPKDLIGIPWMRVFALRADGWYLRQDIIWHKSNAMPESVKDRCTKAHEYIFLLSKSEKYYFDSDSMQEKAVGGNKAAAASFKRKDSKRGEYGICPDSPTPSHRETREDVKYNGEFRNRRSVWSVATKPYKGAHFAVYPPELIEPCILAGSRIGDIVFDPFGGSGTTAQVAKQHGRNWILCELNQEYEMLQNERLGWEDLA